MAADDGDRGPVGGVPGAEEAGCVPDAVQGGPRVVAHAAVHRHEGAIACALSVRRETDPVICRLRFRLL
ncbi:hypothetical protein GCM10010350_84280 [Streptomyces galilaeus]|nr:hypothetical protein GCM10010350_84280 [Streptomyces galilaeus]